MMRLPPLAAIRVFEAAARHQSFTRAAEELGMTQAAVSYQIKVLEDRIGASLFTRMPRQVVLTLVGKRLAPAVTEAFESMRTAFAGLQNSIDNVLSLSVAPVVASQWLVARLGRFQMAQPHLAVQLDATTRLVDFNRDPFDAGIRSGTGNWPDLVAHFLFASRFTPFCSPEMLAQVQLREPEDILKLPLISPQDPWWTSWFAAAGLKSVDLSGRPDNSLGTQQFEGMAAMASQGVALLNPFFFPAEIAAGRLVQPFDLVVESESPYWLVYPKARRRSQKIHVFRDWILAEAALDAARAQPAASRPDDARGGPADSHASR